jgi:hypothetical protein
MAIDDPDFEAKAADIIGLYLNPPQHPAVFCVDEKSAIQALDRLDPVLPLSPGRIERHGFEYYRHGTSTLLLVTCLGPNDRGSRHRYCRLYFVPASPHGNTLDSRPIMHASRSYLGAGRKGTTQILCLARNRRTVRFRRLALITK